MENYLLLVVLPNLAVFFAIVGFVGIVATLICFVCTCDQYATREQINRYLKVGGIFLGFLFISCFIPCEKQIIELKVISTISELKGVSQIPQKMIDRINDLLDMGKKKNE